MASFNFIPHDTKIDFIKLRYITFTISALVIVASLVGFMTKGLNYGIDFLGGYIFEVRMPEKPNTTELRQKLSELGLGEVSIQEFGQDRDLLIRVEAKEGESSDRQTQVLEKIKGSLGEGVDYRKIETVGPKVGSELIQNGIKAVAFALIAMLIYIIIRFEWQFGVCAMVALLHDCIIITGLFSLLPFEFNDTAIITILLTAGYSINDTIVIFDRIRENIRKYKRLDLPTLLNRSINETLSRTVLTGATTLLALTALYFWGGKIISGFSLPIIIGVIFGSASSIFLAAPLLLYLNVRSSDEVMTAANS